MATGGSKQKVLTRFVERLGRRHGASEKSERDGARERRFVQPHVDKSTHRYAPSFFEGRGFLNETHPKVEELVDDIRGKLEPGDHAKLYEAGYFARGPVLEIGRLHGRSTVVLAMGIRDGRGDGHLTSIEYDDRYLPWARRHLKSHRLLKRVTLLQGDSSTIVRGLDATFDTVFVDGDHSYDGVIADIGALEGRIAPTGVIMFHDYFHPLNETGEYGVRRAVDERKDDLGLEYRGRFGGIALFERVANRRARANPRMAARQVAHDDPGGREGGPRRSV